MQLGETKSNRQSNGCLCLSSQKGVNNTKRVKQTCQNTKKHGLLTVSTRPEISKEKMNISNFGALNLNPKAQNSRGMRTSKIKTETVSRPNLNEFENINILNDSNMLFNDSFFGNKTTEKRMTSSKVQPLFQNMNLYKFEPNEAITGNIFDQEPNIKSSRRITDRNNILSYENKDLSVPKRFIHELTPEVFSSKIAPTQPAPSAPENESFMYFYNNNVSQNGLGIKNQQAQKSISGAGDKKKTPLKSHLGLHDFSFDQNTKSIFPENLNKSMADLDIVAKQGENPNSKFDCSSGELPRIEISRENKDVKESQASPIFNFSGKLLQSPQNHSRSKFFHQN